MEDSQMKLKSFSGRVVSRLVDEMNFSKERKKKQKQKTQITKLAHRYDTMCPQIHWMSAIKVSRRKKKQNLYNLYE